MEHIHIYSVDFIASNKLFVAKSIFLLSKFDQSLSKAFPSMKGELKCIPDMTDLGFVLNVKNNWETEELQVMYSDLDNEKVLLQRVVQNL